jgi:hypothetical protein
MQMPAKPVDVPGPLGDPVFSVIDQQTQLTRGWIQVGGG